MVCKIVCAWGGGGKVVACGLESKSAMVGVGRGGGKRGGGAKSKKEIKRVVCSFSRRRRRLEGAVVRQVGQQAALEPVAGDHLGGEKEGGGKRGGESTKQQQRRITPLSPLSPLTVSSGWYQLSRAFLRVLGSSTTRVDRTAGDAAAQRVYGR